MRFSWVPRGQYDAAVKYASDLAYSVQRAEARFDALLEKYHGLKVQGAVEYQPPQILERKPVDPITAAITRKAKGDSWLRATMLSAAQQAQEAGISDEELIAQIEAGVSDDDGLPL